MGSVRLKVVGRVILLLRCSRLGIIAPSLIKCLLNRQAVAGKLISELLELLLQFPVTGFEISIVVSSCLVVGNVLQYFVQRKDESIVLQNRLKVLLVFEVFGRDLLGQWCAILYI